MKKIGRKKPSSNVRRMRDPIPWKYSILTLCCGFLLVGGFFMAARLHFSSMSYGIENSTLRKQVKRLRTENRQLTVSRETALSNLRNEARKLGFQPRTARNIEVVSAVEMKPELASSKKEIGTDAVAAIEKYEDELDIPESVGAESRIVIKQKPKTEARLNDTHKISKEDAMEISDRNFDSLEARL